MNYTLPKIPGVRLEVYKQNRQLSPEDDGYVGQLFSGSATVLAVIDPGAVLTIGAFRDGKDHYILQKDWLNDPRTPAQQQAHQMYLAGRKFTPGTKVFGVKVPLRVVQGRPFNTVHYPENMFMLARYDCGPWANPASPDCVLIWKVALVSQNGDFFLTTQEAYDVMICDNGKGKLWIPRLQGHKQLEKIILANKPEGFRICSGDDQMPGGYFLTDDVKPDEGIVERWYFARNMGCVLTQKGPARVHWSDVPPRPRLRFLMAGEKVRFARLSDPPRNPKTELRKMRKARFELQASGIKVN